MYQPALDAIRQRTPLTPQIALVLGSGLGAFANEVENAVTIPYAGIPGWPVSTAIGHAGQLVVGTVAGTPIAVMSGRVHLYEGYTAQQVVFGTRVLGNSASKPSSSLTPPAASTPTTARAPSSSSTTTSTSWPKTPASAPTTTPLAPASST